MKALFVKGPSEIGKKNEGLERHWLPIDRLLGGLLSRALYRGAVQERDNHLLCLRPEESDVDFVWVWTGRDAFPWKKVTDAALRPQEAFFSGEFSEAELKEGRRCCAALAPWVPA